MKKAFYIRDFDVQGVGYNALNKSRRDLIRIYEELSFERLDDRDIEVEDEKFRNLRKNTKRLSGYVDEMINKIEERCSRGDYLFMDFPFAIKFAGISRIATAAYAKKVKLIFFIHDLDGIRFQNPVMNILDSTCLDLAYSLISASPQMDKALRENLKISKKLKLVNYRYWDYLCNDVENNKENYLICFAGNLAKSSFIKELPTSIVEKGVSLYGKGYDPLTYKGEYKGEYTPDDIVSVLDGKFGLVWDGNSAKTCSGNFGKYLRINTSHKFALYMASRKPVIVWKNSTLSDFVEQKGIGFSVSSLYEIPYRIMNMTDLDYIRMKKNVVEIRKEVITGDHLKKVIIQAMK